MRTALKRGLIETPFTFNDICAKSLSDADTVEEAQDLSDMALSCLINLV